MYALFFRYKYFIIHTYFNCLLLMHLDDHIHTRAKQYLYTYQGTAPTPSQVT